MSDNDNDELESTNQSTEEVVKTDDVEDESANDESEDIEKLRESNKRLFERTKKAEAEAKLLKAERVKKEEIAKVDAKPVEKQAEFDLEDVAVFVQKVPNKEDRELVKDYAKFKGIRLEEALEVPVIVATLKDNDEKRKSAAATNTGTGRRGVSKPSPEQIIEDAQAGKAVDADELAQARLDSKRK
jgi:hypothetical protein